MCELEEEEEYKRQKWRRKFLPYFFFLFPPLLRAVGGRGRGGTGERADNYLFPFPPPSYLLPFSILLMHISWPGWDLTMFKN